MKKLLLSAILASSLMAMGQETIESLSICKSKNSNTTYLVTISDNETEGRAIWIDDYELLIGDYPTVLVPIHDKKSFKSPKEILQFMKKHFGSSSCIKADYDDVQKEIDRQAVEYQKLFKN